MGKSKKQCQVTCLPACQPCLAPVPYIPDCDIPDSCPPVCDPVYQIPCSGGTYCQSTTKTSSCTKVVDSRYAVNWTIDVHQGVPSGVFNDGDCVPLVTAPVPYYLQEMNGNTKSENLVMATSAYTGCGEETSIAAPVLGVDYDNMIISDTGNRFFLGAIPLYFVTASTGDTDDSWSLFSICSPELLINVNVAVQATTYAGETQTLTKIACIENMAGDCPEELNFKTFRMRPLRCESDTLQQPNPVFVTMILSKCCKFTMGLIHGVAIDTTSGGTYGSGDVEIEWCRYNMIVGKADTACSTKDVAHLLKVYDSTMFNEIYTQQISLTASTIATLSLLLQPGGVPIAPGNLTAAQRTIMVKESSASMVKMWADAVDTFNLFIKNDVNNGA